MGEGQATATAVVQDAYCATRQILSGSRPSSRALLSAVSLHTQAADYTHHALLHQDRT